MQWLSLLILSSASGQQVDMTGPIAVVQANRELQFHRVAVQKNRIKLAPVGSYLLDPNEEYIYGQSTSEALAIKTSFEDSASWRLSKATIFTRSSSDLLENKGSITFKDQLIFGWTSPTTLATNGEPIGTWKSHYGRVQLEHSKSPSPENLCSKERWKTANRAVERLKALGIERADSMESTGMFSAGFFSDECGGPLGAVSNDGSAIAARANFHGKNATILLSVSGGWKPIVLTYEQTIRMSIWKSFVFVVTVINGKRTCTVFNSSNGSKIGDFAAIDVG